jgi:hypothetical protein
MGSPVGRKSNGLSTVLSTIFSLSLIYRMELFWTSTGFSDEDTLMMIIRKKNQSNVLRKIPTMVARVYFRKLYGLKAQRYVKLDLIIQIIFHNELKKP